MATYILIIYQNYIIPNLGEYILKISLKSVDNSKSSQSPIDFTKKAWTNCLLKNLQEYGKVKDIMSHWIFETDLEKKSSQKNDFFLKK